MTPDSFSDGGQFAGPEAAITHGLMLRRDGADVLDIGGESTRPGAAPVSPAVEAARVVPVIQGLRAAGDEAEISVDTRRAAVAEAALDAGATIVNDVSAGRDPAMFGVVASRDAGIALMHMQGDPQTMQQEPSYEDVVDEVAAFLQTRTRAAEAAGIQRIWVDPGIGFGKSLEHNVALVRAVARWPQSDVGILLGVSRKSFLGKLTGTEQPDERLGASLACVPWAMQSGADIRVHDVRQTRDFLVVARALTSELN